MRLRYPEPTTLVFSVALYLMFAVSSATASDRVDLLEQQVRILQERLYQLEAELADIKKQENADDANSSNVTTASNSQKESSGSTSAAEEATEKGIKVHGSTEITFSHGDSTRFNEANKDKLGDSGLNLFSVSFDGQEGGWDFSANYRWYSYMDVIHHAWLGYTFNEEWQMQFGITQVPFGILPYADNNWWFGIHYYLGLEDDYDTGVKFIYDRDDLNVQLAFFKNAEWSDGSKLERYSYDPVTGGTHNNEEINTLNGRVAYQIGHGDLGSTELGFSLQAGQLYNTDTRDNGDHWAGALHLNGYYGNWNLMLEAMKYNYRAENPAGISNNIIQIGAFADTFDIPAEANVYVINLSREVDATFGPINYVLCYNDYSWITGGDVVDKTQFNVLGCAFGGGPMYTQVDFLMGKNFQYFGGGSGIGQDESGDSDWNTTLNISVGYYF